MDDSTNTHEKVSFPTLLYTCLAEALVLLSDRIPVFDSIFAAQLQTPNFGDTHNLHISLLSIGHDL